MNSQILFLPSFVSRRDSQDAVFFPSFHLIYQESHAWVPSPWDLTWIQVRAHQLKHCGFIPVSRWQSAGALGLVWGCADLFPWTQSPEGGEEESLCGPSGRFATPAELYVCLERADVFLNGSCENACLAEKQFCISNQKHLPCLTSKKWCLTA